MESYKLKDLVPEIQKKLLEGIHVCQIGKILSYNEGLARIKPLVDKKAMDGSRVPAPDLTRVPVVQFGNSASYVKTTIQAGQLVLVVFGDFSLEELILSKEVRSVVTEETGRHLMSNAVALNLGYGFFEGSDDSKPDALELVSSKMWLGSEDVDLVSTMVAMGELIQQLLTLLSGTVQGPDDVSLTAITGDLSDLITNSSTGISKILSDLESIKA